MALVIKDRVKETTTTTGTGAYTLAGAEQGYQAFSVIGDGNTTYYTCTDNTEWEVGIGTYTASGTTLARTTILASSNSDAAVNWAAGEKFIFVTQPASKANIVDDDGYVTGTEFKTHIDFNTTDATKPAYAEGRLFYDEEYGALGFYNNEADVTLQIGQEEWIRVYNATGSAIANGTPVYATGATGEALTVAPADATTEAKARVIGIVTHSLENSTYGYATTRGLVSGLDTSSLTAGNPIHLAVAGGFQHDAPTYPYFPTDLGFCVVSDATNGYIYVTIEGHTYEQFRVTGNQHVDGDLVVDGDLTINGTQTITNTNNIALSGAFNYFNSGDTIGASGTSFTGTGLNDGTFTGHYSGTSTNKTFYVKIDGEKTGTGGVDTFAWSIDNFTTTEATGVDIDLDGNLLGDGISITFNADKNHTLNDVWSGTASPTNVDTGIASNRNTGTSGVGYTHIGFYYDVSTNYWTLFDEYSPEPEGTIDTGHASFSYGTLKADTVIASLTGNVTGNADTATNLLTARNISLTGDVSGSTTFDGTANVSITATVANDSHTHDTQYVKLDGSNSMTGTLDVPTVDLGDWTITESGGNLIFQYQGTTKFSMDTSGTMRVANDVETDATF
jgi:hypothetical protein